MIRLNIHQAKTHLSRHLKKVAKGEVIILCNRNVPIAEIRPIPKEPANKRRFGRYKGKVHVGKEIFDPLPDEELALWYGEEPAGKGL